MGEEILWLDLETYCVIPIDRGVHVYAEEAEITLFAYAINEGPAKVWDCTDEPYMPDELYEALLNPNCRIIAHNAEFDREVLWAQGYSEVLPIHRWFCTMAQARAHGFPGSLGKLCTILGVPNDIAKEKEGKKLVLQFCKPLPKNRKIRRATRETHPEDWAKFVEYARLDVESMRAVHNRLPKCNYNEKLELPLWHLDQKINHRGFKVDTELIECAIAAIKDAQADLSEETQDRTYGMVSSATKRNQLLEFLNNEYNADLSDLRAATLEKVLANDDVPNEVKELVRLRLSTCKTSTAKYAKVEKMVGEGGRVRGTLAYSGAARTRRWSGRGFQPQNLARPSMKLKQIGEAIASIKDGTVSMLFDVMEATSNTIRGVIVASEGKKLVVSDLSNIEGRGQAWLAGEDWKLKAFLDYDNGTGHDLYVVAYARAFGVDPSTVTKDQRQIGKVMELAMGYEGGVGAFVSMALVYNMDLEQLARDAVIPEDIRARAIQTIAFLIKKHIIQVRYTDGQKTYNGLSPEVYAVCECLKIMWRDAHPKITQLWKDIKQAATNAIQKPGAVFMAGPHLRFKCDKNYLRVALPSGRYLMYYRPRVEENGGISYFGTCSKTHQWKRIYTYGGKIFENATQSVARDFMADNMEEIEDEGYEIVLSVHDELITEAPDIDLYSHQELSRLLAKNKPWGKGIPLAAGGYEAYTYRKD